MTKQQFEDNLKFGQLAETAIAKFLMAKGWLVCPAYEKECDTGKGPRLFGAIRNYVLPDMTIFKGNKVLFVEAKHKTVFTWFYKKERWTTGIDLHHYADYRAIAKLLPYPLWLLFLHRCSQPTENDLAHGAPDECPTGLFGGLIDDLETKESHRSKEKIGDTGWGRHGMVYWADYDLRRIPWP